MTEHSDWLLADGFWISDRARWKVRIVKMDVKYPCKLLGKQTDIGIHLCKLHIDESPAGPDYLLTLDGEGVDVDGLDVRYRTYEEFNTQTLYKKDAPVVKWIKTELLPKVKDEANSLNGSLRFIQKQKKHRLMADDASFRHARRDKGVWHAPHPSVRSKIGISVHTKFMRDKGRNYITGADFAELDARLVAALKQAGLKP